MNDGQHRFRMTCSATRVTRDARDALSVVGSSPLLVDAQKGLGVNFGLWRVRFPPFLVRPGRRLPVQELSEGSLGCLVLVFGLWSLEGALSPLRAALTGHHTFHKFRLQLMMACAPPMSYEKS